MQAQRDRVPATREGWIDPSRSRGTAADRFGSGHGSRPERGETPLRPLVGLDGGVEVEDFRVVAIVGGTDVFRHFAGESELFNDVVDVGLFCLGLNRPIRQVVRKAVGLRVFLTTDVVRSTEVWRGDGVCQ